MLRRLLRRREESNHPDLPVLSVYREHGVIPKSSRDDNHNRTPEDLTHYLRVCPADLVVNKMKAWSGSLGVAEHEGIVSGDYLVCEVSTRIESRYLHHLLRSHRLICEMRRRSRGIRPQQERLYWENLGDIQIVLPAVEEQRRIADFLDDQVTRMDAAMVFRAQERTLLQQWLRATLDETLTAGVREVRTLQSLTDPARLIQYGIVLPGPDHPGGVPIVKGGDVAAHRMDRAVLARTSPEIDATCPRSRLIAGDLLMAIRGSVGEVAQVPPGLAAANITQDVARIAPLGCDPRWLRWTLQTATVQGRIQSRVTGATIRGINIGDLRRAQIPFLAGAAQRAAGVSAERAAMFAAEATNALDRSRALFQERKAALITAAVTGEFDVTTAGPRAAAAVTG
jgi:type I restriction enzyme, S subunit